MKKRNNQSQNETGAMSAKPKKKKRIWLLILIIAVVVAAAASIAMKNLTKQVEMISNLVEIEPVQIRDLSDTLSLKGTVAGISSTNVTSKAVAEITSMNVQVGDVVTEGEVLCTLDSASIQEKIAELEQTLSNASAIDSINSQQTANAVEQAKADQTRQLDEAAKQITRAQEYYDGTEEQYNNEETTFAALLSAKQALEDAISNYDVVLDSTNRAIENAEIAAKLDQYQDSDSTSKETLANLKEQLADCEITAPCSGVVTAVNVRVGDINAEKTTILTIEDTTSLKMVATVQEADILKLEEGMNATITADATGDETINGKVTRVVRVKQSDAVGTDASSGGYSVELSIDNNELLVGMSVKAKVMLKEKGNALAVPYDLIRYDEDGTAYVLVAEKDSNGAAIAVRKNIKVGEEVDYYTEVIGGELKEGDLLIYDYSNSVTEGENFAPEQIYSEQDMGLNSDEEGAEAEVEE
jgi:multidrug efflux pump subunit AcrA (membrane-fusion protein)